MNKTMIALSPLKTNFIEMKNIKIIFVVLVMVLSASAYAQNSGVKTKNPQGPLHVDGNKDNSTSGAPTAAQQANDFVVTSAGNVGIGNTAPGVKLLIDNGANGAAIKIIDGNQLAGRVLTSDVNGVGTWTAVPAFRATVQGTFPSTATSVNSNGGSGSYVYSGVSITLPIGKWALNAGLTFTNVSSDIWQLCYLSSSQTTKDHVGFSHLGPGGNNTSYAGILIKAAKATSTDVNGTSFVTGSSVINVTTANTTIYLLLERRMSNVFTYTTSNPENYFYAVPVQ